MLGISVNGIELTIEPIQNQGNIFIIDFLFLPEINASDPFVLNFFKGRLDFHDDCQLVKHVPKYLELAIEIGIFWGLGNVIERFYFGVNLFYFAPFFTFLEWFVFFFSCFRIWFLGGHQVKLKLFITNERSYNLLI